MKFLFAVGFVLTVVTSFSQSPYLIPYQSLLRNGLGESLANEYVTMRFSLLDGSSDGPVIWEEIQGATTNELGLVSLSLGSVSDLSFIDWADGALFLKVEMVQSMQFITLGVQQLLSVPYALYANHVNLRISSVGDTLFSGDSWVIIPGISAANAADPSDHSCGVSGVHNPNVSYGSMTDQEGNSYRTVNIGAQEWMAENLNVSTYRNGDPLITDYAGSNWQNAPGGAWIFQNNDASTACPYGRLYNWYAVSDSRGICPTGWRVPNEDDWSALEMELGGQLSAGGKMKVAGTEFWLNPNVAATNESGFSGLPGGVIYFYGDFGNQGDLEVYWSATSFDLSSAWVRMLDFSLANIQLSIFPKTSGFHIRCMRE
jgi:uncharacterized protein (TIGR02145 family)